MAVAGLAPASWQRPGQPPPRGCQKAPVQFVRFPYNNLASFESQTRTFVTLAPRPQRLLIRALSCRDMQTAGGWGVNVEMTDFMTQSHQQESDWKICGGGMRAGTTSPNVGCLAELMRQVRTLCPAAWSRERRDEDECVLLCWFMSSDQLFWPAAVKH